jgi:hypothetical protein
MTSQKPNQPKSDQGTPRIESENRPGETTRPRPSYDDRPTPRRDGDSPDSTSGTKERSGEKTGPSPSLPDYGDQEPGDPRRIEIESRRTGETRS